MNWDDLPVSKDQVTVLALVAALVASAVLAPAMAGLGGPDLESGQVNTETPAATEAPREGTSYTASSDGMNDVPESYVANDIGGVVAPNVSTSAGSQTMQVDASGTADRPQLTLTDNQNHEGRVVAIDVAWFKDTIGEVPPLAYVRHESGNAYASPITVENGEAKFAVHEFSTNTVTFDGTRRINAQPATDGDSFEYNMSSNEDVQNFTIDLTGSRSSAWANRSWSGNHTTDTLAIDVGGTTAPEGPAAGDPELSVTGQNQTRYDGTQKDFTGSTNATYTFSNPPDTVYEVTWTVENWNTEASYTVELDTGGTTYTLASGRSLLGNQEETVTKSVSIDSGTDVTIRFSADGSDWYAHEVKLVGNTPKDVTAEADDGTTASLGNFSSNETKSVAFPISENATNISFTAADHGPIDVALDREEQTETIDPQITLNGDVVASYSGTLADGTTVSVDANESLVQSGANTVNVTASSAADGPAGAVGMDYAHTAPENRSVDYSAEAFSESYDVSKTWEEDTENATLRIPWASDRVIGLRDVQVDYYDDTGSHSSTTSDPDYHFDGGDLVVQLGDVPAGWETVVDADGTKVQVANGNITVLEPTAEGSTLDSKIKVDDKSTGFYVAVGGTVEGDRVHYLANESWSGEEAYAEIDANGDQHVFMPNAGTGSETRIRTLPLTADVGSGDIHIEVPRINADEPVYKVSPGPSGAGDAYQVTFVNAADGEDYLLYDETNDIVLDSGTASSPLTLSDDEDDEAIIQFKLDDDSTTSSDGGGSSTTGPGILDDGGDSENIGFLLVVAAVLAALAFIARGDESPVREAGDDIADSIEGVSGRVPVVGPLVGGVVASGTRAVSQGASALLNNRDAAVLLGAGVVLGAIQTGVIDLGPQDTAIVGIVIASLGSLIGLRRLDEFTFKRWALVNVLAGVIALQAVGEEAVLTAIVNSDVFPLIAIGGGVLLYLTIKGIRESQKEPDQNIIIQAESDD